MKKTVETSKKVLAAVLCAAMTVTALGGCGSDSGSKSGEVLKVDVFDSLANYQGIQSGWYGKLVKDKFGLELNIISPIVSGGGESLFETRSAGEELGDIIMVGAGGGRAQDLVDAGLVQDITQYLEGEENLAKYREAIEASNRSWIKQEGLYMIPSEMTEQSGNVSCEAGGEPTTGVYFRWDLYKELGYPVMKTEEDMLPVLKDMQELCTESDSGKKVYAFSFFKDWDNILMEAARQGFSYYGYGMEGFCLFKPDGSAYQDALADGSEYIRTLKLFFDANQMGLIDPESTTQDYDALYAKYQDGAVLYCPWAWYGKAAYNTTEHLNAGKAFAFVPIEDMEIYSYGCYPEGNANDLCIMIGKDAEDPQRIMDFIDWMYSPEGINASMQGSGPEGLTWEKKDGRPVLTEFGMEAVLGDGGKVTVPEEWGTGSYAEGKNQLNIKTVAPTEINPDTGVPYTSTMWESVLEMDNTEISVDWKEKMGYNTPMEYLIANDKLLVSPGLSVALPEEPADIVTIRSQCKSIVVEKSWQMIFAEDEAEFNALLTEMRDTVKGLGYDELYKIDLENAQSKQIERDKMLGK